MNLLKFVVSLLLIFCLMGCSANKDDISFAEKRSGFSTTLTQKITDGEPAPIPPEGILEVVKYHSDLGEMAAYLSPDPQDGKKHPAIIWIAGGFNNSIDETFWMPAPEDNDQSASAFWKSGIITMYPSFRGGNDNDGYIESLYGEVEDVLQAAAFLSEEPYVDANRIYLAGHSTGGTLALLTAETSGMFRAVFAFGPVAYINSYDSRYFTFDESIKEEINMRSPALWLNKITSRTLVIEGINGNYSSLKALEKISKNNNIHFYVMKNKDHFSTLAPATKLIAEKILADTGANTNISMSDMDLSD